MRLHFVSETGFYVYPTKKKDKIWLLWDDQPKAIPVNNFRLRSTGAYETVFLGPGMAIRRDPAWGNWKDRVFVLGSDDSHYFNISIEETLFFCASKGFDARRISKPWNQLLRVVQEKTREELPSVELEAPPSLARMTLGELKQQPGFLGQVVRGVRGRHVVVRQSPGCTYMVCLYGPDEMMTGWSGYPDEVQVWVEPKDYWLKVCEEQWQQRIVKRHPEVLGLK